MRADSDHGRPRARHHVVGPLWLATALLGTAVIVTSCWLDTAGLVPDVPVGEGGSGGAGGQGECEQPEDCDGVDTHCSHRVCVLETCGRENEPVRTPCDESGGTVCNGEGLCVLGNGETCGDDADCISTHCVDTVCCDDECAEECRSCAGGICQLYPAATDPDDECGGELSGYCDAEGACAVGDCGWGRRYGDARDQKAAAVAVDRSGSVIIGGSFDDTFLIGATTLTVAPSNAPDGFVAKLTAGGNPVWSRPLQGDGAVTVQSVAADRADNIFVAGFAEGDADFGDGAMINGGGEDAFVAKLAPSGATSWAKLFGDDGSQQVMAITVDGSENVVVAGHFDTSIDFGGNPLTTAGGQDIFVAKLDGQGDRVWSRSYGGADVERVEGLASDGQGNLLLTGCYSGTPDFGDGPITAGVDDIFLVKLSSNGDHVYSRSFGDGSLQCGVSVTADNDDGAVMVGYFEGNLDFGGGVLPSAGGSDIFVARFDAAGNHRASARYGDGNTDQIARAVAVDGHDSIIVAGDFFGYLDFDGAGPHPERGDGAGRDGFVVKLSASLAPLWSATYGDHQNHYTYGLAVDSEANVLLGGSFEGALTLGTCGQLSSQANEDIFLFKLDP